MAKYIRVYGRCTPFHKVSVVTTFVAMGHVTLMCGDGGNDCGALKVAHVGIALSDAEASLVAPFASLDKSITSVVDVLKEGRCALASALASYKYIIMYGQVEAFINVQNAIFLINLSEYCWVFMDGFWMIFMGFSLPLAKAADRLAKSRPTASLLGPITMASTCGILVLNIFFSILALRLLHRQDWFQCRKWESTDMNHMNLSIIGDNYESSTLFLVTGFQYISSAMCFNFGHEFRQGFFRNTAFVSLVLFFTAIHFIITLVPGKLSCVFRVNCENEDVVYSIANGDFVPIQNPFHSTVMPVNYRIIMVILMVTNTAAIVGWEYFVVNGVRKMLGKKRLAGAGAIGSSPERGDLC
jgi:magnesium-transporting ATPase (P-type)